MPAYSDSLVILQSVDSTNNYAMGKVHSGTAKDMDAWLAIEQAAGKGRRGRHWEAEKGQNITLSIVVEASFLRVYEQFQLSAAVSLSCVDLFSLYAKELTKIKWPNDLFWGDRKAGGVLIENVIKGNIWQWAVIGIGININQTSFSEQSNQPVSLKEISGENYNIIDLADQLHQFFVGRLKELKETGFEKMLEQYNSLLYKRNEMVTLKKQRAIFETKIAGVSKQGQLLTIDSLERAFNFDEVDWLL